MEAIPKVKISIRFVFRGAEYFPWPSPRKGQSDNHLQFTINGDKDRFHILVGLQLARARNAYRERSMQELEICSVHIILSRYLRDNAFLGAVVRSIHFNVATVLCRDVHRIRRSRHYYILAKDACLAANSCTTGLSFLNSCTLLLKPNNGLKSFPSYS